MKKYLSLILIISIISAFTLPHAAAAGNEVDNALVLYVDSSIALVNNQEKYIDDDKSVQPIVENGRTLVPVRFIAENLNMSVDYDDAKQLVSISDDNYNIQFFIGSNKITVNSEEKLIDNDNSEIVAKELNGRTLIPMRCFAESIGKKVFYDRGLIIISDREDIFNPQTDKTVLDALIAKVNALPTVGSAEYLSQLIGSDNGGRRYYISGGGSGIMKGAAESLNDAVAAPNVTPSPAPAPAASAASKADSDSSYSKTNVQVQGVDEADVVKTDGNYLYQVNNQRVLITKVNPASQMSITSIIKHENEQFNPIEIFVDGNKLVIIASVYKYNEPIVYDSAKKIAPGIMPPYRNYNFTQCTVYDITDKAKPVLERTFEVEGSYLSSRKIDNLVYLVSNQYLNYGVSRPTAISYTDNDTKADIGFDKVRYFPGFTTANYLAISSIDITQPEKEAKVETLLGGGENLYVSRDNLYVATTTYGGDISTTNIYKFSLDNGNITYLKKGSVEGNILNQFSMDEYNGYFRIATTTYGWQQFNNLFILDDTMTECGNIRNIAPGERIYSVRFVGNRGYMVTFRQVDPLFVIDLANPQKPAILGNLKIPGYSDYIHPVDENNIIGFGKDATNEGLYQGMKMAMFDVSDVENPKQKFSEVIGDRGTESPLLQNHKALLYAPELNLLAFPVTVREVEQNNQYKSEYGQLTFSGAYVYNFDTQNGFKLKGKISHLTKEDMLKLGNYVDYNKEISRILYAGNSLFTTSNSKVQANSIDTCEYQNAIDIPEK